MTDQAFVFQLQKGEFKSLLIEAFEEVVEKTLATANQPDPEYLTINQLRDYLPQKPAKQTIYQWVHFKQIPYHKRGKSVLFRRVEIDEWIRQTGRTTREEAERRLTNEK